MLKRSLYEQVLEKLGSGEPPPPPPIRGSAAVVLWRHAPGLEVYWVRRSPELAFMGGWHAFPGGGLGRGDVNVPLVGWPSGIDGAPADAALPAAVLSSPQEIPEILEPGLLGCAVRELFEETGLLLPARTASVFSAGALRDERRALLGKKRKFPEVLERLAVEPDVSAMSYGGRWVTPPLGPLRFDNRFFLLEWPPERELQPEIWPGELAEGEWIAPGDGVERWRRGEVLTAPPIVHILRVLAEDGLSNADRLHRPVEANLGPYRKVEFYPGVLLYPLPTPTLPPSTHTNAYQVGFAETVLVDPGSPFPAVQEQLVAALEAARLQLGRRVKAIVLTHHHRDHIGAVQALREALDVPVLAHAETAARVPFVVDRELVDGQHLTLEGSPALTLEVLHTPGHAPGHLCLLDSERRFILAGDMVAGFGTIVVDPPEGDMRSYLGSLARLRDLGAGVLFPAHGPTLADASAKFGEYLEHRHWREQRIVAAWRRGLRRPEAMLPEVYDDVPEGARPLALRQILAHLERLHADGELSE